MASEHLKLLVAQEIASGATVADLARRHDYSWKGMKGLVESPDVQALVHAERQDIATLAAQCRAQLLQLGPEALANIADVLRAPGHPKQLEISKFVTDKILPARTAIEAELTVEPKLDPELEAELHEVMRDMAQSLAAIHKAQAGHPSFLSRVRSGPDALPRAGIAPPKSRDDAL